MSARHRVEEALQNHGCRGRASSWQCPAHEDRAPSLSIGPRRDGNGVVLNCHAGCATEEVVSALGITLQDLFDEPLEKRERPQVVAEYPYPDEHGEVLYVVRRLEPGYDGERKTFRQFRPDGTAGVKGIRRVLYRLPDVLAMAQAGGTVLVVEGEKDVENLAAIGCVATCNVGGAGKWNDDYARHFQGAAEVIVIADRDDPGRKHAATVADSVQRAGIPVRVLEAAKGKDVSDHLAAGLGYEDLVPLDGGDGPGVAAGVSAAGGVDNGEPWDEPVPLSPPPPPELNAKLLGQIGVMAQAVADSFQVPVDLPAWLGVAAASTAIGGRRTVSPKPDWVEPVTTYVMPVAAPGEMKSPVLGAMAKPLYDEQRNRRQEDSAAVARDQQERRIAEACVADAETKVIKAPDANKRAEHRKNLEAARAELEDLGEPKVMTRFTADDITPEAAADLMAVQGERLAILSTEGSFLGNVGGRYSKNPNPETVLKAWSHERHSVDRKNGPPILLERPNLTLGLAAQPGFLTGMGEAGDVFEARGLMARFIFSMPVSRVGDRVYDTDPIPHKVKEDYAAAITAMIRTIWDDTEVREMDLDADARASFRAFWEALEPRHKEHGDLAAIEGWAKKLPGQVLRIAAVLTLFEDPDAMTVPGDVMDNVVALVPYLIAHAKLVADLMSEERQSKLGPARAVLAWMRKKHPEEPLTTAEVQRGVHGQKWCQSTDDVDAALGLLERSGWIRWLPAPEPTGRRGRPPAPRFEAHPRVLEPPR